MFEFIVGTIFSTSTLCSTPIAAHDMGLAVRNNDKLAYVKLIEYGACVDERPRKVKFNIEGIASSDEGVVVVYSTFGDRALLDWILQEDIEDRKRSE